jgi:hypothetical protein
MWPRGCRRLEILVGIRSHFNLFFLIPDTFYLYKNENLSFLFMLRRPDGSGIGWEWGENGIRLDFLSVGVNRKLGTGS